MNATHRLNLLRLGGVILGGAALAWTFRDIDGAELGRVFEGVGASLPIALLPFALVHLADVIGMHALLAPLGARPRVSRTFETALLSEAILHVLPLGSAFSETLRPVLLVRRAGVSAPFAIGMSVARKFLIIASEAWVVLGLALFGASVLTRLCPPGLSPGFLRGGLFVCAGVLTAIALSVGVTLARKSTLTRCWLLVRGLTPQRWRSGLRRQRRHWLGVQGTVTALSNLPARAWLLPAAMYLGIWILEALETYVLLALVGANVTWQEAFALEVVLGFVRSLAVISPGGLGLQDAGYAWMLSGLDPQSATTTAAFVLLKRSKEMVWCAFAGIWFLWTRRVRALGTTLAAGSH